MHVEDIGTVAPGRLLVRVRLEGSELGGGLVRPDSLRSYLPLAQIVQVGEGCAEWLRPGDWYYISQYAGQIISLEGVGGESDESRLICTPQDLLCRFGDQGLHWVEKAFAA